MQTFDIEQKTDASVKTSSGIFITTKILVVVAIVTALIFAGSIIATYFGKTCTDCNKNLSSRCNDYYCDNRNILEDWYKQCTTLAPTTSSTTSPTTRTSPVVTDPPINWRIPTILRPYHYDLLIKPYFRPTERPEYYDGSVAIKFRAEQDTSTLIFHHVLLEMRNDTMELSSITDNTFTTLTNFAWTYDSVTSQVTVTLPLNQMFRAANNYTLKIDFRAYPNDENIGFYRTSYKDDDGNTRWLITSQLEYIEARRSFPCFDEPSFKSTYKTTIVHDRSLTAMTNMPIARQTDLGLSDGYDWIQTEYEESVPMSSYLIGILISDFGCNSDVAHPPISQNVDVSVCVRPNRVNDLDLAMEAALRTLEFFEGYYKVEYPLPKLDHVGVPTFKYGAMENWGLAIYLETNFIFNENSTQATESNVVRIIAHEISHMWFGNLVTPKWWDDLWLNEGFARYAEHLGSDAIRPDWRMFDRLYDLHLSVMQSDSSDVTRPVSVDVQTPEEIDGNINPTITYGKGAAIVKMLTYVLGKDTFTDGLSSYFTKFAYQNVDQFDLWDSLYEEAQKVDKLKDLDFTSIMTSWTKQKGHPVITITRQGNTRIQIEQNRFILDTTVSKEQLKDVKWWIPFTYSIETVGSTTSFTNTVNEDNLWNRIEWLRPNVGIENITLSRALLADDFIIANLDMAGFYRVNYDTLTWNQIIKQLTNHREQLSARARATLVSDVFSLTEANYIKTALAFDLARYLTNEDDYLAWNVFISRVAFYQNVFDSSTTFGKMQSYLNDLARNYYTKLGWVEDKVNDKWTDRLIRNTLVSFACRNNLDTCVSTARGYFNYWVQSGDDSRIPRGFRSLTMCIGVYAGTESDFQHVFETSKKTTDTSLRTDLFAGLACSKDTALVRSFLNDQLSSNQNIITALVNVANRPGGYLISWDFLKAHWDEIYAQYSSASNFPTLIRDISYRLRFEYQLNDFAAFFTGKTLPKTLQEAVDEAAVRVKSNIKWYTENSQTLVVWFNDYIPAEPEKINFRLPLDLKPTLYDFKIKPYIGRNEAWTADKDFTFEGSIDMHFTCDNPTNKIIFHAAEMTIIESSLTIRSTTDTTISVGKSYEYDKRREFVTVTMNKQCTKGATYILSMDYDGKVLGTLYGFYRSSYIDENGKQVYLGTTQFQPTDARRALPCMDEPGIKSKFRLTLTRHISFPSTFFNTPRVSSTAVAGTNGQWFTDLFETTVDMSSYLVAFIISDFKKIATKSAKGIDIEVAAKPHSIDAGEGEFALSEAAKIIDFFADYFDVPYPLAKSTQIAIPDFNAGAMENWGLITYRETDLLFNPTRDQVSNQRRISSVVSHELAHQWFGNLVTPAWWNDLWLNEGFASWVEYLGYDFTHPEWRDLEFFFVQKLSPFVQDSLESSHPISVEVNDPAEINSLFDAISYSKGSSIIRMMNAFLTENTFKKGVSNYLKEYRYGNAVQDNLWESLTEAAHEDGTLDQALTVKMIMDTWTLQKGYPVVTISRNNNQLTLTQKWFLLNPLNTVQGTSEYDAYKWYVAFTFTTKQQQNWNEETRPDWFKPDQAQLTLSLPLNTDANSWYIGNLKHSGWYRVNYDQNNWQLLINQLNDDLTQINPIHRAQLLDDSFNLGRAEIIDQLVFMDITKYLVKETDPLPFTPAFNGLNFANQFIEDVPEYHTLFKEYYMSLLEPSYSKFGWDLTVSDANDINLQLNVISSMCSFGNKDCISKAKAYYSDWLDFDIALPTNFKNVIYQTVIAFGTEEDFKVLYDIAMKTTDNSEKLRMLRGLAASKDYNLLKTLLYKTSDPTFIRPQDRISYIGTIAANSVSRRLAYDYMEEMWDEFIALYGQASFTLPNLVTSCTSRLNKEIDLARVEDFVRRTPDLGVTTEAFKNAIETIKTNIRWTQKNLETINEWLKTATVTPKVNHRLPDALYPTRYDIVIKPYFRVTERPENYDGSVSITFRASRDTNKLVLHARQLEIVNTTLQLSSTTDTQFAAWNGFSWTYDSVTSLLTVDLGNTRTFRSGFLYVFKTDFKGKSLSDNLGIYRTSYTDNGQTHWLLTTQMEYIEARKSFPCFDEPGYRSVFHITIVHDNSLTLVKSNMPVKSKTTLTPSDGYNWVQTDFEDSLAMSTYLVALLISDYQCRSGESDMTLPPANKLDVDVCTRPNAMDQLDLAQEASLRIVEFFETFYEAKYPLPKLDHVSSPTFAYGAMENWGLAIYLESVFLYQPGVSSQTTEGNVVRIIAHEISHMWFGNLVTPKWWNDLWLNEGFATYAEHVGTDSIRPEWRMTDRLMDQLLSTIQLDSTEDTREVSADVETPQEIDANINPTITYNKGGAIVKSLSYILGDVTFTKGLSRYFNKHALTNVDQFDLWTALHEQAVSEDKLRDVNLTAVMITWTKQKGHPVINIKRLDANRISIRQNRFLLDSTRSTSSLNDFKWWIPFTHSIETVGSTDSFTNQAGPSNLWDKITWLNPEQTETIITLSRPLTATDFLVANLDMGGFYRVNYDDQDWKLIAQQLIENKDQLSVRTRAQLVGDVFSLTQANYITNGVAFEIAKYLYNELDYLPWTTFINRIKYFSDIYDSTSSHVKMQAFLADIVTPYYNKLGWIQDVDKDLWTDRLIRNNLVRFTCFRDQSDCVSDAKRYFADWAATLDLTKIPSGYRTLVLCVGVNQGSESDYNFVLEQARKTSDASLRADLLYGAACTKDSLLQVKLLDDPIVNSTNVLTALINVANRPNGYVTSWNYLKANWARLYARYQSSSSFATLIRDISYRLKYSYELEDFNTFFSTKSLNSNVGDAVNTAIGRTRSNIRWFAQNNELVTTLLNDYVPQKPATISFRLPDNLVPTLYDLTIKPYVGVKPTAWTSDKDWTFEGTQVIHFTCVKPTNRIVFHSIGHDIDLAALAISSTGDAGINVIREPLEVDSRRDFVTVLMTRECRAAATYQLTIKYTGVILDVLYGFYRSTYKDELGDTKYLAVTKFEPTDARRAFPCMDEPALKAQFKFTLIRHKDFIAPYSNTPIIDSTPVAGNVDWITDTFETSVKMSTYLIAFAITEFTQIEATSPKGVKVEVSARPQAISDGDGDFALQEATAILDFFADYFDVEYPLDKSTQIAIPDFNSGAMENWGLVTYRESSLLYNPTRDQISNKRRVSNVVSHELAHQWFGNLVSPRWWNDLWLNEGFASWVEYLGYDFTNPEWRDLEFFFVQKLSPFVQDSLESSHPISVEVNDPAEIRSLFDAISYSKGASIIRMMNAFLTENTFKKGVSNYLKKFAYDNAEQDDLWQALTEQAHTDGTLSQALTIKQIMDTWTLRKGYPLVTINRAAGSNQITLTQKWFLLNPLNTIQGTAEYDEYKWYIPFSYTSQETPNWDFESPTTWFMPDQPQLTVTLPAGTGANSWYIGNIAHSGWYRINYDETNWQRLIAQLNTDLDKINPIHRAQLLDDSFNLGRAEILAQTRFLEITQYLANEEDPLPFTPAFTGLNFMTTFIEDDFDTIELYKKYYMSILDNNYARLGWQLDIADANDISLQLSTLSVMCDFGNADCKTKARTYYDDWMDNDVAVPVNFKNIIYQTSIKYGTTDDWWQLYNKALETSDSSEKLRMLNALSSSRDYSLLKYLLYKSSDTNVVRSQDQVTLIGYIAANPVSRRLAYDYMEEFWNDFYDRYSSVSFTLANLVTSCTSRLNKQTDLNRVENFVKQTSNLGPAADAFKNAIETIQTNIRWTQMNLKPIREWLAALPKPAPKLIPVKKE